jgi:hypothetical protein
MQEILRSLVRIRQVGFFNNFLCIFFITMFFYLFWNLRPVAVSTFIFNLTFSYHHVLLFLLELATCFYIFLITMFVYLFSNLRQVSLRSTDN